MSEVSGGRVERFGPEQGVLDRFAVAFDAGVRIWKDTVKGHLDT